jgi:alpha-L-rhamnosidase
VAGDADRAREYADLADPCAQETPPPAEPSIRQLMDHEPSWNRVVHAARESGVAADEAALADRLTPFLDAPATELVDAATGHGFAPGAAEQMRALINNSPLNPLGGNQ